MTARLLMVALDAADGRLLDAWSSAGVMPNLAVLRARGAVKRLASPLGASDDALWASFQYGVPVSEHGRYHHTIGLRGGGFGMAHLDEGDREPFWMSLGNKGLRVAVLDVPKCPAPRPLNGIHLADWLVHGRYFPEPLSYPESLAAEIVARFGVAPPSHCGYRQQAMGDGDVMEVVGNLRTAIGMKRGAGLHYLAAEPWDLFVIGFKEAHCAGHGLWDFVDAHHVRHDPARNTRLGEPMRTIFQDLDAAIGDLVAAAGPDAEVVAFSTADMEPNGTLDHLLPEIVDRLNRRFWERDAGALSRVVELLRGGRRARRYCRVLPYNENFGALRLRRRGGKSDAARLDAMLDEIEAILRELVDAETGEPVVDAITRPASEHTGAMAHTLPDLLLHYRANAFPRAVISPQLGRIEAASPRMRPGNHAGGGLLVAAGENSARFLPAVSAVEDLAAFAAKILRSPAAAHVVEAAE